MMSSRTPRRSFSPKRPTGSSQMTSQETLWAAATTASTSLPVTVSKIGRKQPRKTSPATSSPASHRNLNDNSHPPDPASSWRGAARAQLRDPWRRGDGRGGGGGAGPDARTAPRRRDRVQGGNPGRLL